MTPLEDLTIRKSALVFESASEARIAVDDLTSSETAGLLQAVVETHAASVLESGELHPVSVTLDLDAASPVRAHVIDLLGRPIALLDQGLREAGRHTIRWNGTGSAHARGRNR